MAHMSTAGLPQRRLRARNDPRDIGVFVPYLPRSGGSAPRTVLLPPQLLLFLPLLAGPLARALLLTWFGFGHRRPLWLTGVVYNVP